MAETLHPADLDVEQVARLLHVQPATVRRRLARKELHLPLSPAATWLRAEDAAALLDVAPATVRSDIRRGKLAGRREKEGRWRVSLRSVLEDPRCDPECLALFGGEPAEPPTPPGSPRRHTTHRTVYVRLPADEIPLLERGVDRHGSISAAVVAGLHAIDDDHQDVDVSEIRVERDLFEEQLGRVRTAHRSLSARAEGRMVDELYCHVCEAWVPIEETGQADTADGGVEVFHEIHGHRSGARFRSNTGLARRARITLEPAAD